MHFNQTEYNFAASVDVPPGTKLGTTWISMPLSFVALKNGSLAPIEIFATHTNYDGLILNSYSAPWSTYTYLEFLNIDYYFDDQQPIVKGYEDSSFLNLTQDNVSSCENEHILIPVDIYTQSELFGIGTYLSYVEIYFNTNDAYFYVGADLSIVVHSGKYIWTFLLLVIF